MPKALNLWDGNPIPCKPVKGNVDRLLRLIKIVICNNDGAKADYLLDWFAHIVQKPHEKPSIALVFIGDEGTGKGLLTQGIMGRILKHRHTVTASSEALKDKFNVSQAYKFLIVLEEACWRGDKATQGQLRYLTGNDKITVEEKFGDRYQINDYARYVITANNSDPVHLQSSNRRWLVFENSDKYQGHIIYQRLWNEIRKKKLAEKFYQFLLDRDISRFQPHAFPKAIDTQGQAVKINNIYKNFLYDLFTEEPREIYYDGRGIPNNVLFNEFLAYIKKTGGSWERELSANKFWVEIDKMAPICKGRRKVMRFGKKLTRTLNLPPSKLMESFWVQMRLGTMPKINEADYFIES